MQVLYVFYIHSKTYRKHPIWKSAVCLAEVQVSRASYIDTNNWYAYVTQSWFDLQALMKGVNRIYTPKLGLEAVGMLTLMPSHLFYRMKVLYVSYSDTKAYTRFQLSAASQNVRKV